MNNNIQYNQEKMYDLTMLEQIADSNFVKEVIKLYLEDSPKDIGELKSALAFNNLDTVQKKAHKLKGSTGMLKANHLFLLLEKMELAAKAGNDRNELVNLLDGVQYEFKRLETALQRHF